MHSTVVREKKNRWRIVCVSIYQARTAATTLNSTFILVTRGWKYEHYEPLPLTQTDTNEPVDDDLHRKKIVPSFQQYERQKCSMNSIACHCDTSMYYTPNRHVACVAILSMNYVQNGTKKVATLQVSTPFTLNKKQKRSSENVKQLTRFTLVATWNFYSRSRLELAVWNDIAIWKIIWCIYLKCCRK